MAVFKEFNTYIQIDENKSFELRRAKIEAERLTESLANAKRYNEHLERMLKQKESVSLSNTKRKKIYHAMVEITGQPYECVKDKFLEIIEGKGAKSA